MKKMFQALTVFAMLAFAGLASAADIGNSFRIHVPFAFTVGPKQFAAGDYLVQQTDSGLLFVTGGGTGVAVISIPSEMTRTGVSTGLVFSNSRLVAVQVNGEGTRAVPTGVTQERTIALSH
ncbi:MAG: hypothetical protein JO270_02095 [Acidobacteriaceae bacterium]|nr:hypothetical protein [Acidobacteriaceae bacterium]MBV8573267.1 hypothetical protein [Acidobacteriaceae bacterium]